MVGEHKMEIEGQVYIFSLSISFSVSIMIPFCTRLKFSCFTRQDYGTKPADEEERKQLYEQYKKGCGL